MLVIYEWSRAKLKTKQIRKGFNNSNFQVSHGAVLFKKFSSNKKSSPNPLTQFIDSVLYNARRKLIQFSLAKNTQSTDCFPADETKFDSINVSADVTIFRYSLRDNITVKEKKTIYG